ncbi:MAG: prepilin-type N-terminal cleavage/methylation domain-containing protein [Deltaproteobacteria bacterium]|nr:prepilin-type N-terminal cleavage/methylation domain-containing protein [Deltaproteobacteria bacterium]
MKKGFSLIEVLIAVLIFSIFTVAISRLYVVSSKSNAYVENHTFATALANSKLRQLKQLDTNDPELALTWHNDKQTIGQGNYNYYRFWSVALSSDILEISVYVTWDLKQDNDDLIFNSAMSLKAGKSPYVELKACIPNGVLP